MKILSRYSIKSRIAIGFALISCFILVISFIAFRGTQSTEAGFERYVSINNVSREIVAMDKSVSDLERSVQNFISTGYDAVAVRVRLDLKNLSAAILATQQRKIHDEKELAYLKRMQRHVKTYTQTFNFAVEERQKRKSLVNNLREVKSQAMKDINHNQAIFIILIEAEKVLYEYLNDPDIVKVNKSLQALENKIGELEDGSLKSNLKAYKSGLIEVVQSTRGFLYLISVVMAAEAQEFSYVSTLLRDSVRAKIPPVTKDFQRGNERTQQVVMVASISLLLLALLFSVSISRSISIPLSKLTDTFTALAQDKEVHSIPGLDLADEIGKMSQAAEVFRQRNEQTKALVKALDQKTAALEHSNAELDQFVYTVSHDLKSPIVTSMGFIGMMQDLAKQGKTEEVLQKLPTLERANKRMGQLVNDLLRLSRVEREEETSTIVDMTALIGEVFKTHEIALKKKGTYIKVEGASLPPLFANESRIMQIFENLISNAIKYCHNSKEHPQIIVGAASSNDWVRYYVRDNGPGIAKQYHEKVFALFQRLSKEQEGTGIGLSIVQKIVKSMGGKIWIESGEGIDGCAFWVEFPKIKEQQNGVSA